jgi:hypothetical protein
MTKFPFVSNISLLILNFKMTWIYNLTHNVLYKKKNIPLFIFSAKPLQFTDPIITDDKFSLVIETKKYIYTLKRLISGPAFYQYIKEKTKPLTKEHNKLDNR